MNLSTLIQEGIEKAQNDYISWSNGWSISWSAEYILTVNIAQVLGKEKEKNNLDGIFIEHSVQDFANECKISQEVQKEFKYNRNLTSGRLDICVDLDENKSTIIEVKNTIQSQGEKLNSIIADIERCKTFIINSSSVQDSYICFLVDDKKSESLVQEKYTTFIKEIKNKFEDILTFETNISKIYSPHNDLYWASVVIRFFEDKK